MFEWPATNWSSMRGQIATRSNDLMPVAMLIGALAGRLDVGPEYTHLVEPHQWKPLGAPKSETKDDFVRFFTHRGTARVSVKKKVDVIAKLATSHELDAIMLGNFWLARFRATPKRKELIL